MIIRLIEDGKFSAYDDAVRFVVAVKNAGIPIAAASSSKNAKLFLRERIDLRANGHTADSGNLHAAFDVDVSGRDFAQGKPNPEIFLTAAPGARRRPPTTRSSPRTPPTASRPRRPASSGRWGSRGPTTSTRCRPRAPTSSSPTWATSTSTRSPSAAGWRDEQPGSGAVERGRGPERTPSPSASTSAAPRSPPGSSTAPASCSPTPAGRPRRRTPAECSEAIADAVRELAATHTVAAVGIGAAGFVDAARSTVMFAPNLAWRDENLRESLTAQLDLPVDRRERRERRRVGGVRASARAATTTTSPPSRSAPGSAAASSSAGRLLRGGLRAWPAEIGHITMVPYGRRCGCGLQGCWEQYGSGRALRHRGPEIARHSPAFAAGAARGRRGAIRTRITGEMVTAAAQRGDVGALHCFDEIGRWIGLGLAAAGRRARPVAVRHRRRRLRGGGGAALPRRGRLPRNLTGRGHRPVAEVRLAELGWEAGMVGAADLSHLR